MFVEMLMPGAQAGEIGGDLERFRFDPGYRRPYVAPAGKFKGQKVVSVFSGQTKVVQNKEDGKTYNKPINVEVPVSRLIQNGTWTPIYNASILRPEQWREIDRRVYTATRQRLRGWSDLLGASSYTIPNAMGKLTLEYYAIDDVGEAVLDMDALTPARNFRPSQKLRSMPLPIIHSDFSFSQRELMVSRSGGGSGLNLQLAEMAGFKIGEMIEKMLFGIEGSGFQYGTISNGLYAHDGNSQLYGYLNHPNRLASATLPVPDGTNGQEIVDKVIQMREALYANGYFGPFIVYHSTDWDRWLDQDYVWNETNGANWAYGVNPTMTLRDRIKKIGGIMDVRRVDYLTPAASHAYTLLMVQMTSDVVQAINGMPITTVMWETMGGFEVNFKVLCIQLARFIFDFNGKMGVAHYTTP